VDNVNALIVVSLPEEMLKATIWFVVSFST
jgi:hypothetical protein